METEQKQIKAITKAEAIEAFEKGEKIRLTSGIWNNPERDGRIAKSVEEIEKFYSWACKVDTITNENGIIDLRGASCCDMF